MKKLLLLLLTTYAISLHAGHNDRIAEIIKKDKERKILQQRQHSLLMAWLTDTIKPIGPHYFCYPHNEGNTALSPDQADTYYIQSMKEIKEEISTYSWPL